MPRPVIGAGPRRPAAPYQHDRAMAGRERSSPLADPHRAAGGTKPWLRRCFGMDAVALFLLAVNLLLGLILLDAEREDETRRRMERVEARRQALRRKDIDPAA